MSSNGIMSGSPYGQNYGSNSPWGNGFRSSYPSNQQGYQPGYPSGNMRDAILQQQEQRRLQYMQQHQAQQQQQQEQEQQQQQQRQQPGGSMNSNGAPTQNANSDQGKKNTGYENVNRGASPQLNNDLVQEPTKTGSDSEGITGAATPPQNLDSAKILAVTQTPSNDKPCKSSDSSSWGHPVWWGWSESSGC